MPVPNPPGVGVDVVDLARIRRSLERRPGALTRRLLAPSERQWVDGSGDPVERLAACFALKEAAIKARGIRPRPFRWTGLVTAPGTVAGMPAMWARRDDAVVALVAGGRATDPAVALRVPAGADASPAALHRAGRAAAEAAVRAVAPAATTVEILPGVHPADDPEPCRGSHPPVVVVDGHRDRVGVSISHCPVLAVAVAWTVADHNGGSTQPLAPPPGPAGVVLG